MVESSIREGAVLVSPRIYTLYPSVRQFETNDLLAQELADLRVARRSRRASARRSFGRRWLVLAGAMLVVVATVTIYAVTL
jgi:hypothetical protein